MKILITYASAGSGHLKAAEAIYDYFKHQDADIDVKLIDVLDWTNFWFKNIYSKGYAFFVNYFPSAWALGFLLTSIGMLRPFTSRAHLLINSLCAGRFIRLLIRENPDFIITTHFLPLDLVAALKSKNKINSHLICVITDFGVHPFWLSKGVDLYVVASDTTKQELVRAGIKNSDVEVFGIPTHAKFEQVHQRDVLMKKFDLEADRFNVLIITGSFGMGPIEKIVQLIHADAQVLVVCARNKKLYSRLKNKNYSHVKLFGFVDNIHELMQVSDLILTKPGGLTISETLIQELAPIFIFPIPGQEMINARILESCGVGQVVKNINRIRELIIGYQRNPDMLEKEKNNIRKLKKPGAVEELFNVIRKDSIWPAH